MKKIKMPTFMYFEKKENVVGLMSNWIKECEGKYLIDESYFVEVYKGKKHINAKTYSEYWTWFNNEKDANLSDITHKAYLIKSSIEPIKKETAESLLEKIIDAFDEFKETTNKEPLEIMPWVYEEAKKYWRQINENI